MSTPDRVPTASAQQVDPLSWFTGPLVPVALSLLTLLYGSAWTVLSWGSQPWPWLQPIAVLMCVGAGLVIHAATRPLAPPLGWMTPVLALALSVAGMTVSAIGVVGTRFEITTWWAPIGLALTIGSFAPYLPVRRLVLLGTAATTVAVLLASAIIVPTADTWGPVATTFIMSYPPAIGTVAAGVFSYTVVVTMVPMIERSSRSSLPAQHARDDAALQSERMNLARLTARAAPFLSSVAESGLITAKDRALAGQLARQLRDDLVSRSGISWLDSLAASSRLVVLDPDRRAQRMNNPQRTALRALLGAILDLPGSASGGLLVELRPAADGATAVAVSLDELLPEGRRVAHLAPYYLTLGTTVDDLRLDDGRRLRLSFRIAPDDL